MKITVAARTDPGKVRELNEDTIYTQCFNTSDGTPQALMVVCDGMGGHLGGELASRWAVEAVKTELMDLFAPPNARNTVRLTEAEISAALQPGEGKPTTMLPSSDLRRRVEEAVIKANQVVYNYAKSKPAEAADAGTTLTLAVVSGDTAIIANVGDSRAYLMREDDLKQVTQDHSLVASLVAAGQIKPEEIFTHPQRNIIFRSLGLKQEVRPDIFEESLQPGDALMLCSDGLWEMIPNTRHIVKTIKHNNPEDACDKLVVSANAGGGDDNISVILAKFD